MTLQYNNPNKFPPEDSQSGPPKQGQNPKDHGYPREWDPPHWHGDDKYNPHLRVVLNEPDGTREYYDPVTGTHSYEHFSGHHHAVLRDGVVHSVPKNKYEFIGDGHSRAVGGSYDKTIKGHVRENYAADHSNHTAGSRMEFVGGVHGAIHMGNSTTEHHGHARVRVVGQNSSWGLGVGPGGSPHDSNIGISPNRIYFRTMEKQKGDIWMQTAQNHQNFQSGKSQHFQAEDDFTVHAKNGKVVIKSGKIYVTGNVMIQGDLQVSGKVQCADHVSPEAHITNIWSTSGGQGSGNAPNLNNPAPAALNSGEVS